MWFKLANLTLTAGQHLGSMDSISKSYRIDYSGLTGLDGSHTSTAFETEGQSISVTFTFTVRAGYEFQSGSTITCAGTTIFTAGQDYAAGATFSATTNINSTVTIAGTANGVSVVPPDDGGDEPTPGSTYTFTITPTPTTATVTLTASGYTQSGNSITVPNGTTVSWRVSADGYTGQSGTWTANGSNESKPVTLSAVVVDGSTTWYVDHRNNAAKFSASVNIAGRGWCHVPGSAAYEAYVGKPVNTIGFFTNKASQEVTISKVVEKGGEADMTEIATVTLTNPAGATKGFCSASFPTVTLTDGECLAVYTQTGSDIQFYYLSSNGPTTDANGIADGQFYGRVPKVYGSGTAWTSYDDKLTLGMSVGYNSDIA